MPDLIILLTKAASEELSDEMFTLMGDTAAKAVEQVLSPNKPMEVAVYELVAGRTINANPVQILCLASKNEERLTKIDELRDAIGRAIQALQFDRTEGMAHFLYRSGPVESWVILPEGSWAEFAT